MRFTVVSNKGEGLGLASHLSSEGHAVSLIMEEPSVIGHGIVQVTNPEEAQAPDVCIVADEGLADWADAKRNDGARVLGASRWSAALESDREYMQKVIALAGWDMTTVSNGVNLYVTTWFNGRTFICTYSSLVYRRFMSGGRGPDVRFTGVVSNFSLPSDLIYNTFLKPLERILRRANHRGCFTIHAVVTGDMYSVHEISASFASPLALLLFENSKLSTSEVLLKLLDETSKPVQTLEPWATGLLLTIPPYPYNMPSESTPIKGLELPALKHLWLVDARRESGEWFTGGVNGKIGYVTARGSHLQEAVKRAYRTVKRLEIRDLQFRDDVGKDLNSLVANLKNYGWLR